MNKGRIAILVLVAAAIAAFFAFDLRQYFSLEYFQSQRTALEAQVRANPVAASAAYFAIYVAVTGLSLPGATIMTLAGGALFGFGWALVLVSFASSIGATLSFLASRLLLRDWVQGRLGEKLRPVNEGVAREGAFYLFAMRLVPQIPFFAVNLAMGLTPIRARTFYWVSQLGMLAGTAAYVYAGTQLGQVASLRDIVSPGLLAAFALLGVFPLVAKKALDAWKARKVYAGWTRPAAFDRNLVAIGAGSAGLVTAYIGAAVKAKVTLVEKNRMGGDCLNTGCVPSKALIRSARLVAQAKRAGEYGLRGATTDFDFGELMERVRRVIHEIEPHDSMERYTALGVECLAGTATITSPWTVEVAMAGGETRTLTTKNIVVATGGRPSVPPIPGLREANPLTSETLWDLRALPRRLVVLGGGPIGCELAQCFARLGSQVTIVEKEARLLGKEDPEFSQLVRERFEAEGIEVLAGHALREVRDAREAVVEGAGGTRSLAFDGLVCALGRTANTAGFGLEKLGIATTKQGTVETDEFLRTKYPNIYAVGDAVGPYLFTHMASHTAWYAAVNALFGRFKRFRVDYSVVPWVTFTEPEIARVGLSEEEAKAKDVACDVFRYDVGDLDRAIADGEARGIVKVLTRRGTDEILGATIASEHAGEMIAEFVLAMRHKLGLNAIMSTIHAYPTWVEANRYAAGAWKRSTATPGRLAFLEAFHAWSRGAGSLGTVLARVTGLLRR